MSQKTLAAGLGRSQSYVSSAMNGSKDPPPEDLITTISVLLNLSPIETESLHQAAQQSKRTFELQRSSAAWQFALANDFHAHLPTLNLTQVRAIQAILGLKEDG